MNESLIGEEVVLEGPPGDTLVKLVLGAADAFLEAADGEPADLTGFQQELRSAFESLGDARANVRARLRVVAAGMEVTLKLEGDSGEGMTVLCRV